MFDDDELRFNLFASFFNGIRETLMKLKDEWKQDSSSDLINETKAFYKIWSALQFSFCGSTPEELVKKRDNFGESLAWAGYASFNLIIT